MSALKKVNLRSKVGKYEMISIALRGRCFLFVHENPLLRDWRGRSLKAVVGRLFGARLILYIVSPNPLYQNQFQCCFSIRTFFGKVVLPYYIATQKTNIDSVPSKARVKCFHIRIIFLQKLDNMILPHCIFFQGHGSFQFRYYWVIYMLERKTSR